MRLTINLATRVYVNVKRLNIFIAVALAGLTLLLLFNIRAVATGVGEMKRLQNETSAREVTAKSAKNAVSDQAYQALLARIKFANGIIAKRTFNWLLLFDQLESVVPDGLSLTSIERDPKGGGLKLAGLTKNFSHLRKFMENLEGSRFFTEVYLVSQSEKQAVSNQQGIDFIITCKANY